MFFFANPSKIKRFGSLKSSVCQWATLPETNSSHLNIDDWNTILSFWEVPIFSGELLVLGRVVVGLFQPIGHSPITQKRSKTNLDVPGI